MALQSSSSRAALAREMAQAFLVNDQMNQLLLQHLEPRIWRGQVPGVKGRTIADIFAHVHNIRCKWIRLTAPHLKVPSRLDRRKCTAKQVRTALAVSALRCSEMLNESVAGSEHARSFLRDGWARPWQPGAAMFAYMIAHDAHHRGQICMLAHQLNFPLPGVAGYGMWSWEKLCKQHGFKLTMPHSSRKKRAPRIGRFID